MNPALASFTDDELRRELNVRRALAQCRDDQDDYERQVRSVGGDDRALDTKHGGATNE